MKRLIFFIFLVLIFNVAAQSKPHSAFYYKQKYGLVLETDGCGCTQRINTPGKSWKDGYDLGILIRRFEVIWLPYKHTKIKSWMIYGDGGTTMRLEVVTRDKSGRIKELYSASTDWILIDRWKQGIFTVQRINRDDGFIVSDQHAVWNKDTGTFVEGRVHQATDVLNKMSLYDIFNSVRICATLDKGRWGLIDKYMLIRFKPSGYISSRLPRKYRDAPCVQAKFEEWKGK